MQVTVAGIEQLEQLGKRLREAGRTDLRRELTKGLRAAARPVAKEMKRQALALPAPGKAIRSRVAKSVKIRVRTGGRDVFVRVVSTDTPLRPGPEAKPMAVHLDRGRWKHPVHGHRDRWVTQTVPPGWFSRPAAGGAPAARREAAEAIRRVREQIEG